MYSTARRSAPTSSPGGNATDGSKSSFRAMSGGSVPVGSVRFEFSQSRNRFHGKGEIFRAHFQTDAIQVIGGSRGYSRTRSHERIQDGSFAHRQSGPR